MRPLKISVSLTAILAGFSLLYAEQEQMRIAFGELGIRAVDAKKKGVNENTE